MISTLVEIEIGLLVLEKIKKKISVFLLPFANFLPLEKGLPFICSLNPLHLRMIWSNVGYNCCNGSGEAFKKCKSLTD
jgi:hypothetical protein